jgi:hypothetical protein
MIIAKTGLTSWPALIIFFFIKTVPSANNKTA